ncbi:MAG: urea ABC transporter permease subunit UrtB, partial [Betaproteobacteria bacterium]|nr:urea ABC transporter permease subunit UrtB [Betaproteobacteria bacterium]
MWTVRIRLSFVFLCCCLSLSVAQALTSTQAIGMVQGETDNRLEILNQALQEADAATANYLQALADDAVKVAGKQVLVLRDGKAFDPVTVAEIPMPAEAEDVVSNNRMRGEIDSALAALKLLNPDDKIRLQAAMALAKEPDAAKLPLINKALKVETNAQVKNALMLAKAAMAISAADPVERLEAAQALAQAKSPEAQLLLNQQLGVETDVKVKAQITTSLATIKAALSWGERLGVVFTGISLGSILLLVALGLAITYGLMGVINMAHGELMMVGAYATYVVQVMFRQYLPNAFDWYLLAALPMAFLTAAAV